MKLLDLKGNFPFDRYPVMRESQIAAFAAIEKEGAKALKKPIVLELPTGSGKTGIGYTFLKALESQGKTRLFYLAPNKTQVEQVQTLHPDVRVAYGRNEHPCLYYPDQQLQADEIPCSLLADCPHRVNQETGETHVAGAVPCAYLKQKYEAKQGGIVVCTTAFYLFTVLFSKEFEPEGVVIDEAHQLARSIRSVLSTELTDWKLERAVETLNNVGSKQVHALSAFLQSMKRLVAKRGMGRETLLEEEEIEKLYKALIAVNPTMLEGDARAAIKSGELNVSEDREVLKQIEDIARSVRRFQHALSYAMSTKDRWPLNFVFAYGRTEKGEQEKWQHKIVVKDYYVVPLIKRLMPEHTLAYSATISDPEVFGFETGLKGSFNSIPSNFPHENARIYMPKNSPDLSVKGSRRQDKTRALRKVAKTAKQFAEHGHRSLVIVVSSEEREKFLMLAAEEGLDAVSYGDGVSPRARAKRFREGEGECLVGTVANYGEGVDLPAQIAPVIFCLRPAFPRPDDPATVFEERRFGNRRWSLWNWRVMLELLQMRGRNIRSETDLGVTFLVSEQFRRFAFGTLPSWLQPAYRGQMTHEECVTDALALLDAKPAKAKRKAA